MIKGKNEKYIEGITLISLVITIIVLIILVGISINLLIGENGVITTATRAREEMKIAEGKEKIELALLDMTTDRAIKGESCELDYVSENIEKKLKDIVLEGVKGNPVVKIYVSYEEIMYKITEDLKVEVLGNINIEEEPELEIIRDVTQTGVEQVNLTVKATVEQGEISEIVKPDGSVEYVSEITYPIIENGTYTFKAVTAKGVIEEKTVEIQSIKIKDAIELQSSYDGEETITCEHIYETKYAETNHWKQCILCNNKKDIVEHSTETDGIETCNPSYSQIEYCVDGCGYKVTLPKKEHSTVTKLTANGWDNNHRVSCSECGGVIKSENCINSNGERLGCSTGISGTCVICGAERHTNHMELGGGNCRVCGKKFYTYEGSKEVISQTQIKLYYKYTPIDPDIELYGGTTIDIAYMTNASITDYKYTKNDDGSLEIEGILNVTKDTTATRGDMRGRFYYTYNGHSHSGYDVISVYPDNYAPIVQTITVEGADSIEEFSRSATVTAKFEEAWDSIVEMALFDEDGNMISDWSVASKDGTIFTKEFNVIAETTTSKELTVKAKDRCGNVGEGKVTIGKIDTKAPTLVSRTTFNDIWRMSLPIKIEAIDEGAGNVQIGLGSETDYQLASKEGENYYRNYCFVGDIYEDVVRIVYIKDAVGNAVAHRITIGKLDRTSPTITNIVKNNKNIIIEANDINSTLNKQGSGIKGYAISKSREVPADNAFQTNNVFTVEDAGTYYIWVKDIAGNLSETKQIEV